MTVKNVKLLFIVIASDWKERSNLTDNYWY